jgi:CheY-like chemotaxis protein
MNCSLLIAGENGASVEIYRRFFEGLGCEVAIADGGLDCLAKLCESVPDLLILDGDLQWGGIDGLLARMREEHYHLPMVPVIVITENIPAGAQAGWIAQQTVRFLSKPVSLNQLNAVVLSILHAHQDSLAV